MATIEELQARIAAAQQVLSGMDIPCQIPDLIIPSGAGTDLQLCILGAYATMLENIEKDPQNCATIISTYYAARENCEVQFPV